MKWSLWAWGFVVCWGAWAQDPVVPSHLGRRVYVLRVSIRPPETEIGVFSKDTFERMLALSKRVDEFEAMKPEPVTSPMMLKFRPEEIKGPHYALSDLKKTLDAALKDYRAKGEFDVAWKVKGLLPAKVEREEISDEEKLRRVLLMRRLFEYGELILNEQLKHHEILHPKKIESRDGEENEVAKAKLAPRLIPLAPPSPQAYENAMPEDLKNILFLLQVRHNTLPKSEVF